MTTESRNNDGAAPYSLAAPCFGDRLLQDKIALDLKMNEGLKTVVPQDADDGSQMDMRTLILESAIKLFVEKGFDGVTMRALAREVGIITPGGIYHHFPDKLSLHAAAVDYAFKLRSKPAVSFLLDKNAGTPKERLKKFIFRVCERFHRDKEFHRLLQRLRFESTAGEHGERYGAIINGPTLQLEAFLDELDLPPEINKRILTTLIFGLVTHTYDSEAMLSSLPGYGPELNEPQLVADQIFRLLEHGIFR